MDKVKVIRVIEYEGPADVVQRQVANSIHGEKGLSNGLTIRAVTLSGDDEHHFRCIFEGHLKNLPHLPDDWTSAGRRRWFVDGKLVEPPTDMVDQPFPNNPTLWRFACGHVLNIQSGGEDPEVGAPCPMCLSGRAL